jgi:hypothetical protein
MRCVSGRQQAQGYAPAPRPIAKSSKVINLMDELKRSLAREGEGEGATATARPKRTMSAADRRQVALSLPVSGARRTKDVPVAEPIAAISPKRQKKA